MSKFKLSAIALAVTAAMGLSAAASAATFTATGGQPANVVYYTVPASGNIDVGSASFDLSIEAGDNLAGRTQGLGVRITLPSGVTIAGSPGVAAGPGSAGGTATVSSTSGNQLIINLTPGSAGLNVSGPILSLTGLQLNGTSGLDAVGGSLNATVTLYDPGTAQALTTINNVPMVVSSNPVQVTYMADTGPETIDVGASGQNNTAGLPKVLFAQQGQINGYDVNLFTAGTVAVSSTGSPLDAGTGSAYAVDTANDTLNITLSGSFNAFGNGQPGSSVNLENGGCTGAPSGTAGTLNAQGNSVSFAGVPYTTNTQSICFYANGQDTIDATGVAAATSFTSAASNVTTAAVSGNLKAMQYNGSSVQVATFNPGANASQQSFLRVANTSSQAGEVIIYGYDQDGAMHGPVTFTLASGHSMQINSDDMENGNSSKFSGSLGNGVGKWRLDVTGEFDGLQVQSLMRNNASGTVTNLTGFSRQQRLFPFPGVPGVQQN